MQRKDRLGNPVSWAEMLFQGKGTANEPMPSVEDIIRRPETQKAIKDVYECIELLTEKQDKTS